MNKKSDYIAVFDSGVGGISVLRQLVARMPGERFLYYGDTAHAPYGTRSPEQVRQLALTAAEKLVSRGIKALVVACNTATAMAIDTLRSCYPDLLVIGIEPALKVAADKYPGCRVGIMATPVTLAGEKLHHQMERFENCCQIHSIPAPGLSELVDAGQQNSPQCEALLRRLLEPYVGKLDALVLGCTHYPFAAATICRILGKGTVLLDGGIGTAAQTQRQLEHLDLLAEDPQGEVIFEYSDDSAQLQAISRSLLDTE